MVAVFGKRWPWPPYVFARLCSFAANHPEIAAKEYKERNDSLIFTSDIVRKTTNKPDRGRIGIKKVEKSKVVDQLETPTPNDVCCTVASSPTASADTPIALRLFASNPAFFVR